ncbi:hypothetical protein M3Y94_00039000 [Aphelenchoides besseyi]|nr:hypothetical protein M3Y94_00039000 [Aphelenchoides besseyi]KAI6219078.1 hypothetical protein M3Y95_01128600 [Aphelenchoides besseyi]
MLSLDMTDTRLVALLFVCVSIQIVDAGTCVDKNAPGRGSDCPNVAYLCTNPAYQTLMADQCPATCGVCKNTNTGGNGGNQNCVDKNAPGRVSDCPRLASYCTNPIYQQLMNEECPKTCGTCGNGGSGSGN